MEYIVKISGWYIKARYLCHIYHSLKELQQTDVMLIDFAKVVVCVWLMCV